MIMKRTAQDILTDQFKRTCYRGMDEQAIKETYVYKEALKAMVEFKFYNRNMIAISIIIRILGLPIVILTWVVAAIKLLWLFVFNHLTHGSEWIAYDKHRRKDMIADVYDEVLSKYNSDTDNTKHMERY